MDVKEFFYNGGCVQCKDRTESDVIIDIVKEAGFSVYDDHDPDGCYHAVLLEEGDTMITFARRRSLRWTDLAKKRAIYGLRTSRMALSRTALQSLHMIRMIPIK